MPVESYPHDYYIDGALALFGVSKWTVVGALYGQPSPLSLADAGTLVAAYVGHAVQAAPITPAAPLTALGLPSYKRPVKAASVTNHALGSAGSRTIDGYSCAPGDRVLLMSQTAPAQNGIYVVGSDFALTRDTDADSAAELAGAVVIVEQGATNADKEFQQVTDGITLGSTAIVWEPLGAGTGSVQSVNGFEPDEDGNVEIATAVLSNDTPLANSGAGGSGTSDETARADHFHPEIAAGGAPLWTPQTGKYVGMPGTKVGASQMGVGYVTYVPFPVFVATPLKSLVGYCTSNVAGEKVRMGVYDDTGAPLYRSGDLAAAADGPVETAGSIGITLAPALYWLALLATVGNPFFAAVQHQVPVPTSRAAMLSDSRPYGYSQGGGLSALPDPMVRQYTQAGANQAPYLGVGIA